MMLEKLFIYGTLGPGRPNEHILADFGGTWEKATITGNLKQQGWGAEMGYPGIVLSETDEIVEGFLFSSENLANNWSTLDEFEGEGYERLLTQAKTENGDLVQAYVYTLKN